MTNKEFYWFSISLILILFLAIYAMLVSIDRTGWVIGLLIGFNAVLMLFKLFLTKEWK